MGLYGREGVYMLGWALNLVVFTSALICFQFVGVAFVRFGFDGCVKGLQLG